jgi:hypothetical protein
MVLRARSRVIPALLLLVVAAPCLATSLINTVPQWDGSSFISTFGVPNTQTYGQTITVPVGETSLTGFRFLINVTAGGPLDAQAFVSAWDTVNNRLTGPLLYSSPPVSLSGAAFNAYTFNIPGGAPVTPGGVYVIFMSLSNGSQVAGQSRWGALTINTAVPGGQFVFQNNGNNFGNLSTVSWSSISEDLAFEAAFGGQSLDAVPVPTLSAGMLALLGAALVLVAVALLRFRNS